MKEEKYPITQAIRFLRDRKINFSIHLYEYIEHGGTEIASQELGLLEHHVIKTIVLEDELKKPVVVLMHGDKQVSTKQLGRILERKSITPCDPSVVTKHTGYLVGGTSPFGTKTKIPVFMEESIMALEVAYINGGKRGFLVGVSPLDAQKHLDAKLVHVAV